MPCCLALLAAACANRAHDPRVVPAARPEAAAEYVLARWPLGPESIAEAGGELDADLVEVRLDLALDLEQHAVSGSVVNRFVCLRDATRSLSLHARGLEISSVRDERGRELSWRLEGERVLVALPEEHAAGSELALEVRYRAHPETGLHFVESADGSPQVWSQNEPSDARAWIPTWDEPNDRARFDARITLGGGLELLANGVRLERIENADGTRTFHWREERPIPAYLFAIAAGRWTSASAQWRGLPLGMFAPPGTPPEVLARAFEDTQDILDFESERFGQPFPWPRYDQVCVDDFVMAGMENAGMTLLTSAILHDELEEQDEIGERRMLLAHETAHQWFGDLVTCLGWRNLWLNEAWASYAELLYLERREGAARTALWFERYREIYLARGEETRLPLSETWRGHASERLCHHEYDKGPWVLRMLEHELGSGDFWRGTRHYLEAHHDGFVTTEDFARAFLESTGRNVLPFLQQWVEGGGHPVLGLAFTESAAGLNLRVEQHQRTDELVPLFDVPLELELFFADGSTRRERLRVHAASEEFVLAAGPAPLVDLVADPEGMLLCELALEKPAAMWAHQAGLAAAPAARWRAIAQLAPAALATALSDPEFLLRARAVSAAAQQAELRPRVLELAHTDPVAFVREMAITRLAGDALSPVEIEGLRPLLQGERSPRVRLALQRALGVLE